MPPFRNSARFRHCVGNLSTGDPIYVEYFDLEQEIGNLEEEVRALKTNIWKKNQRLSELKTKLALRKQEEEYKKKVDEMRKNWKRETLFLLTNDSEFEDDNVLDKSAQEHLNHLCNNN